MAHVAVGGDKNVNTVSTCLATHLNIPASMFTPNEVNFALNIE